MKFVIHATALNGEDTDFVLIDRLVDRLAEEVHRVDLPEADLLEESLWYRSARQTRRKVLMSAVSGPPQKVTSGQGPHVKVVEVANPESVRLAEKLAHAPLVVLVEDREADGVLLEIIVEELGWSALKALWKRAKEVTPALSRSIRREELVPFQTGSSVPPRTLTTRIDRSGFS